MKDGVTDDIHDGISLPRAVLEPAWILCMVLALVAFLIDSTTPHGVADGFLYVLPVLVCFWVRSAHASLYTAIALMLPLGLGAIISPAGASIWIEVTNRLLGATTIWLTALLIFHNARLAAQRERLLERIRELNHSSEQANFGERIHFSRWLKSGVVGNLSTVGEGLDIIADEEPSPRLVQVIATDARELIDAAIVEFYDEEDRIRVPVEPAELEWFVQRRIDEFSGSTGVTVTVCGHLRLSAVHEHRAALCSDKGHPPLAVIADRIRAFPQLERFCEIQAMLRIKSVSLAVQRRLSAAGKARKGAAADRMVVCQTCKQDHEGSERADDRKA